LRAGSRPVWERGSAFDLNIIFHAEQFPAGIARFFCILISRVSAEYRVTGCR
jgi:hypothetical protein